MSVTAVFAALGDDVRLRLIQKLVASGPSPMGRLAEGERVTRQAIAKHLGVLGRAGLAVVRRKGREQIWTIEPARLREAEQYLEQISSQWDLAIERLRTFVEEPPEA